MKAEVLYPSQCILGEGPIWHAQRKCCFWVDIEKGILYEYKWLTKITKFWRFDYKLTLVIQATNNYLILGLNSGIARFDLESENLEWLLDIETEIADNRCNDGACDSYGRLWIGTMQMHFKKGAGSLYCIDKHLNINKKLDKVSISNGIAWSLDNKKLYYIDSPTQIVQSFIFDEETGNISFEKNVIQVPVKMGTPDGMIIDEEGMLWIAHWGGFGVYRWNPLNGKILDKIEIPAPNVTSCAFAGTNLDHLVITTAKENLKKEDLRNYPESGNTFVAKTQVRGVVTNTCLI
jgi:sugar lactone lactonase YvrE